MEDKERWDINSKEHEGFERRLSLLEGRMTKHDVQYATINTKLSVIIGTLSVVGTALCGVLVKLLYGA